MFRFVSDKNLIISGRALGPAQGTEKALLCRAFRMQLLGQLQNPSPSLQVVSEAFPDGPATPSERPAAAMPSPKRLGNDVVKRAVVKVLAASTEPMRVVAIQTAVQALLGHAVSYESVSWCLRMGSRKETPLFVRPARGYYQLASQT
jgi:hypothetical protein